MRTLFFQSGCGCVILCAGLWLATSSPVAADREPSAPDGVLVLTTGQLVSGKLSQNAGGYVVELPKGKFFVPFERVRLAAKDGHEAYLKLKKAEPNPTPSHQIALARWCISWKLFAEARVELRDALVADPDHEEARQMYARLHRLMNAGKPDFSAPKVVRNPEGFTEAAAESLAGLSPEAAKEYALRVQPILQNRCGNAGCHAPSSAQQFHIARTRAGFQRQTRQNLSAVLKWIELKKPEDSPLLKKPAGPHGLKGRSVFIGSAGEQNQETLTAWVEQVAGDLTGETPKADGNSRSVIYDLVRRDDEDEPVDETLIRGRPAPPKPLTQEQRDAQAKEELLDSILKNEQPDAFDPEVFNRRYGAG